MQVDQILAAGLSREQRVATADYANHRLDILSLGAAAINSDMLVTRPIPVVPTGGSLSQNLPFGSVAADESKGPGRGRSGRSRAARPTAACVMNPTFVRSQDWHAAKAGGDPAPSTALIKDKKYLNKNPLLCPIRQWGNKTQL